jgi:hypothetical protein
VSHTIRMRSPTLLCPRRRTQRVSRSAGPRCHRFLARYCTTRAELGSAVVVSLEAEQIQALTIRS